MEAIFGPASQMLTSWLGWRSSQPIRFFRLDAGQMAVRPPENLKSQEHLDSINIWTKNQKMKINQSKTKTMIFNHTNNFQFNTRLKIDNQILETVNQTKLSWTIINNDLKWDSNVNNIVKKAYARMELLRKLVKFKPPKKDFK